MKQYTVQWANNIIIGHGNIGAGVDWQKQSTAPAQLMLRMDMINVIPASI